MIASLRLDIVRRGHSFPIQSMNLDENGMRTNRQNMKVKCNVRVARGEFGALVVEVVMMSDQVSVVRK